MLRTSLAVFLLLGAAPSCPDLYSVAAHGFVVPTLSARGALGAPAQGGLRVTVDFAADNPNNFPLTVSGVDYALAVEGTPVFAGSRDGVRVQEHGTGALELSGVIDTQSGVLRRLRPGQSAAYLLTGTVHVATPAGVPVDVEFSTPGAFLVPGGLPASR